MSEFDVQRKAKQFCRTYGLRSPRDETLIDLLTRAIAAERDRVEREHAELMNWIADNINTLVKRAGGWQCLLWPQRTHRSDFRDMVSAARDLESECSQRAACYPTPPPEAKDE